MQLVHLVVMLILPLAVQDEILPRLHSLYIGLTVLTLILPLKWCLKIGIRIYTKMLLVGSILNS